VAFVVKLSTYVAVVKATGLPGLRLEADQIL
jgi:hypothetical protein